MKFVTKKFLGSGILEFSNDERQTKIIEMFESGINHKEIAKHFSMESSNVSRFLKSRGYKTLNRKESQRFIDKNYFADYNDKEVSYWLGMLMTDGNVARDRERITLSLKDEDHMLKYIKFLDNKVKYSIDAKQYRVSFNHEDTYKTLINYGIVPNKSLILKINIPITFDMLRGIIDGDGSWIKINKDSLKCIIFSASQEFIEQIKNFLDLNEIESNINVSINGRKNPIYHVSINKHHDVIKLLNNLYENDNCVYLERKLNKIKSVIDNGRHFNYI